MHNCFHPIAVASLTFLLLTGSMQNGSTGETSGDTRSLVEVRLTDGGIVKLQIMQATLPLTTPYGKLSIPRDEIRLVELAPRVPMALLEPLNRAVAQLGSDQYEIREKATADLLAMGPAIYPALAQATKETKDLEIASRLESILEKLSAEIPEDQLEPREFDVVQTIHSRISGTLELSELQSQSSAFGEMQLKLSDVRDLVYPGGELDADLKNIPPAPVNLYDKASQIGKTFTFRVQGSLSGPVYGTDVYTLDSSIAAAAVHAGALKNGKVGIVRVKILESPESFTSSSRNGVSSFAWSRYPAAYKILKGRR